MIGVYSATLDENKFDFDETDENKSGEARSRKDVFLKSLEDRIDPKNSEHKERLTVIKNQILEKVKRTQISRSRSRSNSLKRGLSNESLNTLPGNSPVRPRTTGIPKKK